MALNFPNSPTLNQVYTDSTSGFSYQWNGTVWISFSAASSSQIKTLDDISASFNNSTQTFALTSGSVSITPPSPQSLIINLGGVIQDATDDYSVSGSNIVFSTAPTNGLSFSGISLGPGVPVDYANNGNVYTRTTFTATASQTTFTVTGTYTVGYLEVYQNGVRLSSGTDYTATTGTTFVLTTPANLNDEIESIGYKVASIVTTTGQFDNLSISGVSTFVGFATHTGTIFGSNLSLTGIATASSFVGALTGTASTASFATTSFGLSGSPNITVGIATASSVIVGSAVTINSSGINVTGITTIKNASGTVTIGIGTTALLVEGNARVTGILTVGSSSITLNGITDIINVGTGVTINGTTGTISATSFSGDGSGLTGVGVGTADNINTTGIITASVMSANEFIGTGDKLIFSPTITSFSPTDGATGVSALSSPNIILTYNQQVGLGTTGTITLREDSAAGTIVESFSVGVSTRATVSNQTLTIDPTSNLDYNQEYYLVVPQGGVTNQVGGNSKLLDTYNFTTEAGPTLSSVSPGIGSTNIAADTNIIFTFNKNIRAGVGTITLRTVSAGGTIVESYDVASSGRLTFSTSTLTIDPTSNLGIGITHFVVVPNNAVAGYAGINTYSFTTVPLTLSSINPANGATAVALNTNITLTFNGPPIRGTGTITLRRDTVGGTILESFDAASSGQISISSNDWILDPTSNLPDGPTTIFLVIPNTAITGYVGLNTAGAASHSFATIAAPALGDSYEGGFLICKASPLRWVVSPYSAEVSRTWYLRNDANTRSQQVSGCTGWFVPTVSQLQNPGFICRSFWGSSPCYSATYYWTSTEIDASSACRVDFGAGNAFSANKSHTSCVRAFRCVTY